MIIITLNNWINDKDKDEDKIKQSNKKKVSNKKNDKFTIPLDYYGQGYKEPNSDLIVNNLINDENQNKEIDIEKINRKKQKDNKMRDITKKRKMTKSDKKRIDNIHKEYDSHERNTKENFYI